MLFVMFRFAHRAVAKCDHNVKVCQYVNNRFESHTNNFLFTNEFTNFHVVLMWRRHHESIRIS